MVRTETPALRPSSSGKASAGRAPLSMSTSIAVTKPGSRSSASRCASRALRRPVRTTVRYPAGDEASAASAGSALGEGGAGGARVAESK
jgi:hypothetical protein